MSVLGWCGEVKMTYIVEGTGVKMDGETYKTMNQLPLSKVAVDECREDEQHPRLS